MKTLIPFQEIDTIPKLIRDFLDDKIEDFKPYSFNITNIAEKIEAKSQTFSNEKREVLVKVIQEQYEGIELSSSQKENLEALLKENTFTITTGHQLNLFTGPVFFIYKILQTIKTSVYLKEQFPEKHFVPIFWMATEDHDFVEINHFRTDENYYEIEGVQGGAVGRIKVESNTFLEQFKKEMESFPFGKELTDWLDKAYGLGQSLSQSIRILAQKLFSDYGLLLIDGDDKALKSQMSSIFKEELFSQKLYNETKQKVAYLAQTYSKVQVNPREINLFYLTDKRQRIDRDGDLYRVIETKKVFTEQEMLEELQNFPERFSPNALMRPVYQETVLPNIVYIGGNAEIMYWLELVDYFKSIGLEFPILIPRHSFTFIDEKTFAKIGKLELNVKDFFNDYQRVFGEKLLGNSVLLPIIDEKEKLLKQGFDELKEKAQQTEVTFFNLVEAEQKRQLKSYQKMRIRLLKAEKKKNQDLLERLNLLANKINPNAKWQERQYNFSVFYRGLGRKWLDICLEEMPVDKSVMLVLAI
ncbi:bacillithiol biosynthesis cysteine-adding enzyme BshC [Riemerella anatipestifer]|uniref:bacillithiol biosynthesis cysteine-adding enzyme BshC n=1 Tax=Riemerella anatipestifer TaxID=34085 RepID=UPI002864FD0C|nr:bacillithiol biosynthesis cysteine-adding enzyme BshC [Riemerella anatipestifer]MDR7831642.1 bacillithiol biosynthesis cysteine-adding enzyme BshC [Riemerella anatipestifer]